MPACGTPAGGLWRCVMEKVHWKGSNGGGKGWTFDNQTATWQMPEAQSRFLDWLLSDPKLPATRAEWARENGLHEDTPKRWKRDKRFQEEWERRAREKNISVDRVQSVVDALHTAAVNGDVKAANLYLQYIDRFTPRKIVKTEDATTSALSDEQLMAELRALTADIDLNEDSDV